MSFPITQAPNHLIVANNKRNSHANNPSFKANFKITPEAKKVIIKDLQKFHDTCNYESRKKVL